MLIDGGIWRLVFVLSVLPACAAAIASPYRVQGLTSPDYRLARDESPGAPALPPARELSGMPYASEVEAAARHASLDVALVHAVIHVESRHQAKARSPKGAIGLMQVLPDTAARYGVADPGRSTRLNLRAGTLYLRDLMAMFNHRLELVLAAYNAGENAVVRHAMKVPPYPETRRYVRDVLDTYRSWRRADRCDPPLGPSRDYAPGTRLTRSASWQ